MSAILEKLRKPTADPTPPEEHERILQQASTNYMSGRITLGELKITEELHMVDYKKACMEIGNQRSKSYRLLKFLHLI
jgi:hypothetical protein